MKCATDVSDFKAFFFRRDWFTPFTLIIEFFFVDNSITLMEKHNLIERTGRYT